MASPSHQHWVASPKARLGERKEEPETDSGKEVDGENEGARVISGTELARSPGLQKRKLDCTIQSRY